MIRNKKINALITATIMSTALSLGTSTNMKPVFAYAIGDSASLDIENIVKDKGILEETLNELINEKVITKEKADNILSYVRENAKDSKINNRKLENLFGEMVEKKILTEEEAEAIRERNGEKIFLLKKDEISKKLDELVKNNTITQEQKKCFMDKLDKAHSGRKEIYKKLKGMSEKERKEYIEKNNLHRKDIIDEMLKENIINESQAESMRKSMPKLNNKIR